MSNITDTDDDFALARPVVFGPAFAVIGLMVILLIVAVLLFARNRQARIARLRERIGLAESRVNALLKLQPMIEVKEGENKQSSDEINKRKDERVRDNETTPPLNTSTAQQAKFAQSTNDQLLTSPTTIAAYRTHASVEKCGPQLRMSGLNTRRSSLESLENASHVAVISQCLYSDDGSPSYMRGDRRIHGLMHADRHRSNLSSLLDRGYSSSEIDGWV